MKKLIIFTVIAIGIISCLPKVNSQTQLILIDSFELSIKEPSGITVYNNHLYIVSDNNGTIYKTTLKGEVVKKIKTGFIDLEGVAIHPETGNIFVVDESKRTLIELNSKGELIKKTKIEGKQKHKNSGLEGICFDSIDEKLYVVNEKSPKQLLTLSLKGKIKNKVKLDFSKDLSGICFENSSNTLWIISDESQKIYNITKEGKLLKSYKIPVEKGEGIVIVDNLIYIVSDDLEKLYIFKKPV